MAIVATVRGEWAHLTLTWRSGAAELYLILLGSLVGYSVYVYALKHLPLSTVSLYAYVNPVIAVALGTVMLGEPFGWRVVVAPLVARGNCGGQNLRRRRALAARCQGARRGLINGSSSGEWSLQESHVANRGIDDVDAKLLPCELAGCRKKPRPSGL